MLDDAPWLGKPAEVDSNQIETLIENNQHYTTWEIADILKISRSIKLLVKMKMNKLNGLFGPPNTFKKYKKGKRTLRKNYKGCTIKEEICTNIHILNIYIVR